MQIFIRSRKGNVIGRVEAVTRYGLLGSYLGHVTWEVVIVVKLF